MRKHTLNMVQLKGRGGGVMLAENMMFVLVADLKNKGEKYGQEV